MGGAVVPVVVGISKVPAEAPILHIHTRKVPEATEATHRHSSGNICSRCSSSNRRHNRAAVQRADNKSVGE